MPTSSTTISGLASGIDWNETIDLLMQIEYQPVQRLIDRQDEFERKVSAWTGLQSKLEALQSSSNSLDTLDELLQKTASSSDTDKLSASANADAVEGSHTIIVNQLAQAEVEVHSGHADINTTVVTVAAAVFKYDYAGTTYTVDVPANAKLADLVQLINNDGNNPGVIASTIDDGGGVDPVHLVLASKDPGSTNIIAVNAGTTVPNFGPAEFTETISGQDAQIRVDGYPPAGWITRESNVIDDVISGITLTLKETDAVNPVQVSVENDYATIKQKIKDWVSAYNDIMDDIAAKTSYDAENEIRGIFMGDSQVRSIQSQLRDIMVSPVPGVSSGARYTSLAEIGLEIGSKGKVTVDNTELQEALEENMDAVADLFVFSNSSTSSNLAYFTRTDATQGGEYQVTASYLASGKLDPNGTNTIGGYAATVENNYYLVGKDDTPVEGLRVRFIDPGGGPGSVNGTIYVGTGAPVVIDNLVENWTDYVDGLIKVVKEGYENQINNINKQLLSWERRIDQKREMLAKKFIAMEQAVSLAKNQSSWIGTL